MKMTGKAGGFTVVEMMVVLAIVAILAIMAVPSYLDRIVRKQIETALPLADIAKQPVASSWAMLQTFPADNAAAGLPVADKIVSNYVKALTINDGVITLTFGNRAHGALLDKTLTLRPAVVIDAPMVPVAWVCGNADAPDKMTLRGNNQTTVPNELLPLECMKLKRQ